MKRRDLTRRGLLAVVLSVALLGGGLVGCGVLQPTPEKTEETTVDYGDVANAVTTAVPRVVVVEDPGRWRNGLGHALELTLLTDSAEPFTSDDLDAVVKTIWVSLPWEPNAIMLVAGTADDREPVDLRVAAAELDDLRARDAGQAGVTLSGMKDRYGAWTAPE